MALCNRWLIKNGFLVFICGSDGGLGYDTKTLYNVVG